MIFEIKTIGWEKIGEIFEEMINRNLKSNATFGSVRNIIEKIEKKEKQQKSEEIAAEIEQNCQELNAELQQSPSNEEQKNQEIQPSVIQILPSVIPQSPVAHSTHSDIPSDQPANNQFQANKHPGVLIQIKEDRSMCKIHITQPIILICNVCYKLLCIRCLNQHEQHAESSDSEQYQSLELFIKNELQNQQTLIKLKQISAEYTSKIKEFQKKVTENVINFESTFIENLKKTLIDQIDKKKMELIGYLKSNQFSSIEELIKANEQIADNMNSVTWLFKNFDMIEDVNDVYKFNEFYEIIKKVQLSKVFASYDKIISSVNERVKELSSSMIMQLLKQFFDNLQRLNPEDAIKMNQSKTNEPAKFKYAAKEAEQHPQKPGEEVTGRKRNFDKFMSFKTVKEKPTNEINKDSKWNFRQNGIGKSTSLNSPDIINIEDEDDQMIHEHEFQSIRSMKEQQQQVLLQSGEEEEARKRNSLIQKYKERKNDITQKSINGINGSSSNHNNNANNDDDLNFEFPPKKNVHFDKQQQLHHHQLNPRYNNSNLSIPEFGRKRQQLEDQLLELKELQQNALQEQPPTNFYPSENFNSPNIQQQQQQSVAKPVGRPKRTVGRKTKTNTCGHPELPHKSLGKCAKCYFEFRKSLKSSNFNNSNSEQPSHQFQKNDLFQIGF